MRRILNLNQPGILFLRIIGLLLIVIPAVLYGISFLLHLVNIDALNIIVFAIKISLFGGVLAAILFTILVIAEQVQDHIIDIQYQKNRDRKAPLGSGNYECQYCGSQRVKETDRTCRVCGRDLRG